MPFLFLLLWISMMPLLKQYMYNEENILCIVFVAVSAATLEMLFLSTIFSY